MSKESTETLADISKELLAKLDTTDTLEIKEVEDIAAQIENISRLTNILLDHPKELTSHKLYKLEKIHSKIHETLVKKAKRTKIKGIKGAAIAIAEVHQAVETKRKALTDLERRPDDSKTDKLLDKEEPTATISSKYKEVNERINLTLAKVEAIVGIAFKRPHPFITRKLGDRRTRGQYLAGLNEIRLRTNVVSAEPEWRNWVVSHEVGHYVQDNYEVMVGFDGSKLDRFSIYKLRAKNQGLRKEYEADTPTPSAYGWNDYFDFRAGAKSEGFAEFVAAYTASEAIDPEAKSLDIIKMLSRRYEGKNPSGKSLIEEAIDYYDSARNGQKGLDDYFARNYHVRHVRLKERGIESYRRYQTKEAYRFGAVNVIYNLIVQDLEPDKVLKMAIDPFSDSGVDEVRSDNGKIRRELEKVAARLNEDRKSDPENLYEYLRE